MDKIGRPETFPGKIIRKKIRPDSGKAFLEEFIHCGVQVGVRISRVIRRGDFHVVHKELLNLHFPIRCFPCSPF